MSRTKPRNKDLVAYYRDLFPCDATVSFFGGPCPTREYVVDVLRFGEAVMNEPWNQASTCMHRYCHVTDGPALKRMLTELEALRLNVGAVYSSVPPMSIVRSPRDMEPAVCQPDALTASARRIALLATRDRTLTDADKSYHAKKSAYSWKCANGQPVETELRFYFDIKDIDESTGQPDSDTDATNFSMPSARSCGCHDNEMCAKCWPILASSAVCLDKALDFVGFQKNTAAWFYSGNRGLHCYAARNISVASRSVPSRMSQIGPTLADQCTMTRVLAQDARAALRSMLAPPMDQHETLIQRALETFVASRAESWSLEELIVKHCWSAFVSPWYFEEHTDAALRAVVAQKYRFRSDIQSFAAELEVCAAAERLLEMRRNTRNMASVAVGKGTLADMLFFQDTATDRSVSSVVQRSHFAPIASSHDVSTATEECLEAAREFVQNATRIVEDNSRGSKSVAVLLAAACSVMCPRVDSAVTDQLNHPLKAPMAAHPSTGRIAIPICRSDIDTFSPLAETSNGKSVQYQVPVLVSDEGSSATQCSTTCPSAFQQAVAMYEDFADGRLY